MLEQGRVAPGQVWLLIVGFMVGTAILYPVAPAAGRDAWLAVPLGGLLGLLLALVYTSLLARFPGLTVVEIAARTLGRWLGGAVGFLFSLFALHTAGLILRTSWEFLATTIFKLTPPSVTAVTLTLLIWYATRGGLEVIARTAQVLVPLGIVVPTLVSLSIVGEVHVKNLLPVLEHGWIPVIHGSLQVLSIPAAQVMLFTMVLPYMRPAAAGRRVVLSAIVITTLLGALVVLRYLAMFGPLAMHLTFPAFSAVSALNMANFLQGLEGAMVVVWIAATFVKTTVSFYAGVLGLAQSLGLRDYRPLTGPLAVSILIQSFWAYPNSTVMASFLKTAWVPYSLTFEAALPLLLLVVALLRGAGTRSKTAAQGAG
ncbi:MAG: GerAB/ArcD/ProY family transporter [Symbiobacteriia bacterium]